jgi:hypothetical protein
VQIIYNNISKHSKALLDNEVDLIIIAETDIAGLSKEVRYKNVRKGRSCLVIPTNHPLAEASDLKISDFKDETFIVLDPNESEKISRMQTELCEKEGFRTLAHVAPNIATFAIWLETGFGISTLNPWHMLQTNPNLKFIEMEELEEIQEVVAWLDGNNNPAVDAFLSAIDACTSEDA